VVLEDLEGLDAIGRLEGLVPSVAECPDEEAAHVGLVVDDEDLTGCDLERPSRFGHPGRPSRTARTASPSPSMLKGFGKKATP
jgi:hypothetical protein